MSEVYVVSVTDGYPTTELIAAFGNQEAAAAFCLEHWGEYNKPGEHEYDGIPDITAFEIDDPNAWAKYRGEK